MTAPATLYVEARHCTACTHIGLNDSSDTHSVCTSCPWAGPTPAADCCPDCGATGTISAACPKCGESYVLMAESTLPCGAAPAPAAAGAPLPLAPRVPLTVDEYQAKYARFYRLNDDERYGYECCWMEFVEGRAAIQQQAAMQLERTSNLMVAATQAHSAAKEPRP